MLTSAGVLVDSGCRSADAAGSMQVAAEAAVLSGPGLPFLCVVSAPEPASCEGLGVSGAASVSLLLDAAPGRASCDKCLGWGLALIAKGLLKTSEVGWGLRAGARGGMGGPPKGI